MVAIVSFGTNYEIRPLPVTVSSILFDKRKAWKQDTPLRAMNLQAISIFCNASAALVTHISGLPGGGLAHEPRVIWAGKQDSRSHFRRCNGDGKGAWDQSCWDGRFPLSSQCCRVPRALIPLSSISSWGSCHEIFGEEPIDGLCILQSRIIPRGLVCSIRRHSSDSGLNSLA